MFKKVLTLGIILSFTLISSVLAQTVVKDDFRVNDDFDIGGSNQSYPAIAMDNAGNFVVVWVDGRNRGMDIYGQRYDRSGNPLGGNFKVNESQGTGKYSVYNLTVSMDANGDFVVVWLSQKYKNFNIYAQRYDSIGTSAGGNFTINDDQGKALKNDLAVSMNPSGEFIVVWKEYKDMHIFINSQRYSSAGDPIRSNSEIVSLPIPRSIDLGLSETAVAINPKGEFVAAWTEIFSQTRREIHAIRVNADNEILGSEFKVNDNDTLLFLNNPDVGIDAAGDFVITWLEKRTESQDIYAQRYNFKGDALGSNFRVNEVTGRFFKAFPKIAMNLSKKFIIAWIDSRDRIPSIYFQYYNQSGEPEGGNVKVAEVGPSAPSNFGIAKAPSGYLALTWDGYECKYDNDIFAMIINQKEDIIKEQFKVDKDSGSSSQGSPAIAASISGKFEISWADMRLCDYDIFAQRFNSSGEFIGSNFIVNQEDAETGKATQSSIAVDSSGNFVVTFLSYRDVYLQRYNFNGEKLGNNILVNDNPSLFQRYGPNVAMDKNGDFVVVWTQKMGCPNLFIFAQLYDSQGNKVDTNFMVNSFIDSTFFSERPKAAKCSNGNFVVVWQNSYYDGYKPEIWGQLFNPSGERIGENFRIGDTSISNWDYSPEVGMDKEGNFVVTWIGAGNLLVQRFKSDGSKIGSIIKAVDFKETLSDGFSLAVKLTGEFLVVWTDNQNGNPDIYTQRFDAEGNPLGENFRVNNDQGDNIQQSPAVATDDKNYYFTWVDNRNSGSGFDIFCKVLSFEPTFVSDEELLNKPEYLLLQNYPNPFNPTTTISFKVKSLEFGVGRPIHTTLIIYNLLGQKVKTLVDEDKLSGRYQVNWDGKNEEGNDVSSGIYFYVIKTKDVTQTKKMTLVR